MGTTDRTTLREWLDLEVDGQLVAPEKVLLEAELDPELLAERRQLRTLYAWLGAARIPVRAGFRAQIMASLPEPAWLRRRSLAWVLPAAMALSLGLAAAYLLSGAALGGGVLAGTGLALVDFLIAASLAGAGFLAVSWRGVGFVLEEIFARSGVSLLALAVPVLLLNLLFFSLLRGRRKPAAETASADDQDS